MSGLLSPTLLVVTVMVPHCIATEETVRPVLFQVVQLDIQQQIVDVHPPRSPALENTASEEPVELVTEHAISINIRCHITPMVALVHQQVEQYVEEVLQPHLPALEQTITSQAIPRQQVLVH